MQRGFIIAVFSIIAIIIGLAAAMKLSAVAAVYLQDSVNISSRWLPFISFIVVLLLVIILVRLAANFFQKIIEIAFLGWVNKLAGAMIYALLYTIVFSIILFFAEQLNIVKDDTIANSKVYPVIKPMGPYVINGIGSVIPFFQDMFHHLQEFFENMSNRLQTDSILKK
jgi:membrane protein required for colicin V production